jgi:hypothetical protein
MARLGYYNESYKDYSEAIRIAYDVYQPNITDHMQLLAILELDASKVCLPDDALRRTQSSLKHAEQGYSYKPIIFADIYNAIANAQIAIGELNSAAKSARQSLCVSLAFYYFRPEHAQRAAESFDLLGKIWSILDPQGIDKET